jgi:hypothetical protein
MSDGVEYEHKALQDGGTNAVVTKKLMCDRRDCDVERIRAQGACAAARLPRATAMGKSSLKGPCLILGIE